VDLNIWSKRWNIPPAAIIELQEIFGIYPRNPPQPAAGKGEMAVLNEVRLEAARLGIPLWRNNTGAVRTEDGRFVRFGLANDSAAVNAAIKSSDLIGIAPGGQFLAVEIKGEKWVFSGNKREMAQLKFLEIVTGKGGQGFFINNAKKLKIIVDKSN